MRHSLYWDDFEKRIVETANALNVGNLPPVRRVAVFITEQCNFNCKYCKAPRSNNTMSLETFNNIVEKHSDTAIVHITGGEPSVVDWLYPYLEARPNIRFNLNTNAYIPPPLTVKRLKVSLDSCDAPAWNKLVGHAGAFERVVENIKRASEKVVTSITYTMTHENILHIPDFISFSNKEFPSLYALFFSIYKGTDSRFVFSPQDQDLFFKEIRPKMIEMLPGESSGLLEDTLDEKKRLIQGVRFPENSMSKPCYLSMSERVYDYTGREFFCSHLYRDRVQQDGCEKHPNCEYGCNRRLVAFNEEVERLLG